MPTERLPARTLRSDEHLDLPAVLRPAPPSVRYTSPEGPQTASRAARSDHCLPKRSCAGRGGPQLSGGGCGLCPAARIGGNIGRPHGGATPIVEPRPGSDDMANKASTATDVLGGDSNPKYRKSKLSLLARSAPSLHSLPCLCANQAVDHQYGH